MSDWNAQEGTATYKTWDRSWRQEFFTDLGTDFTMRAHMQRVVVTTVNGVESTATTELPTVERRASQVSSDPRVQQLQALLTELIAEWAAEDAANGIDKPQV